uniref:Uncharacterized protein n=1 Tax=Steinernema glaseri TaxID=37863 RepID=A0A1I8A728_9BILA
MTQICGHFCPPNNQNLTRSLPVRKYKTDGITIIIRRVPSKQSNLGRAIRRSPKPPLQKTRRPATIHNAESASKVAIALGILSPRRRLNLQWNSKTNQTSKGRLSQGRSPMFRVLLLATNSQRWLTVCRGALVAIASFSDQLSPHDFGNRPLRSLFGIKINARSL